MRRVGAAAFALLASIPLCAQHEDLGELSIEELMAVPVVSASNFEEELQKAPATMVLITADEIRARGYREMSEILDDLPGMDVVRPWGATWVKNYWRGYRNTIGDPYLLLVDGLPMNHLYTGTTDIMAAIPLSNVERIEVVYGPASVVYGANAMMGVIHVITWAGRGAEPRETVLNLYGGEDGVRIVDGAGSFEIGQAVVSYSGRWDEGRFDSSVRSRYEYTRSAYVDAPELWGGFAGGLGESESTHRNRSTDLRLRYGRLDAGFISYDQTTGYGVEYATDRAYPAGSWRRPELTAFARLRGSAGSRVRSSTLVRWRRSDVDSDSSFLTSTFDSVRGEPLVEWSWWAAENESFGVVHDVALEVTPRFSVLAGAEWERRTLQKEYEIAYGPAVPVSEADPRSYPFPGAPDGARPGNSIEDEDLGGWLQGRVSISPRQRINFGVRADRNSRYGTETTVRAGWVGTRGPWVGKLLYGEGFQEPHNRLLYGGWDGSGSDPMLDPERSETIEAALGWTRRNLTLSGNVYHVASRDTFITTAGGARNLGERDVTGVDLHFQYRPVLPWLERARVWAHATHVIDSDESHFDGVGLRAGAAEIGDIAEWKLQAGASIQWRDRWNFGLRGRWIGERRTVATNPIGSVPSWGSADLLIRVDDVFTRGLGVSIDVRNVGDARIDHPGTREGDAGLERGSFVPDEGWSGSAGYFNSLMPQPGRSVVVGIHWR